MSYVGKKTKLALKLAVSFGILAILFSKLDGREALEALGRASPVPLILAVLVLVSDRVWMAWKWKLLLSVSASTISLREAVRVYYISSFQGNALPIGGLGPDVVRYFHLRRSTLSPQTVAISIVVERVIGLLATIGLATAAAVIIVTEVGYTEETYTLVGVGLGGGIIGCLVIGIALFSSTVQKTIYEWVQRMGVFERFSALSKVTDALARYRNQSRLLSTNLILALLEQLFPVLAFYLGAVAFDIPLTFLECLAVIPFSSLLQRLPISYAGLGIREGVQVFLLGLLGVAYAEAVVLSSALFIVFVISLIPGGLWSLRAEEVKQVQS